jgi:hypothetical protein
MVRNTIGYGRIAGDDALQAVYAVLTPRYNVFYPNLTCVDKLQIGQKKRRVYEPEPKTPFPRILALPDSEVPESCKRRLVEQKQVMF